ncbi:MAG: hypothetical protein ACI9EW_003944 [Cellvibrionaceae bacterium]|jgi:hypothetical protein
MLTSNGEKMTLDYAKGLTFAFEDKDWLSKLGKGALWAFISTILFIIPLYFFMLGYALDTARNVMKGEKHPLPNLDDVGEVYKDGARFFVVTLFYSLPAVILYCIMFIFLIAGAAASESAGISEDTLAAAMGGGMLAVQCILYIYLLIVGLMLPAIMVRYLRTDDIRETLNIGQVFAILRENFVPCLMIMLMYIAATIIWEIVLVVSFITICGWIFVLFAGYPWLMAVQGHLVGQFASQLDDKTQRIHAI